MSVSIRPAYRSGRAPAAPPAALAPLALAAALLIAATCAAYRLSGHGVYEAGPTATITTPAVAAPASKSANAVTIPVREATAGRATRTASAPHS